MPPRPTAQANRRPPDRGDTVALGPLDADATAPDMYAAIDLLADKLDRLVVKLKEKMKDHHRGESAARMEKFG